MPHKAVKAYQWICLRNVQSRTQRALSTTSAQRTASSIGNVVTAHQNPSTEDLKSLLHAEDDAALANTKRHVAQLSQTARAAHKIFDSLPAKASKIQLLPEIPPYTSSEWRVHKKRLTESTAELMHKVQVVFDNLTDLESIPYRSDGGPSRAQKFRMLVAEQSQEAKEERLRELMWHEESHGGRLQVAVAKLKAHVQGLEKVHGKKRSPFAEDGGEDGGWNRGGEEVVSDAEGFGYGAKAPTEVEEQDPFVGTTINVARSMIAEVKESQERATRTGRERDVSVPKAVDAVEVPPATVAVPAARSSLQELQARLERKTLG